MSKILGTFILLWNMKPYSGLKSCWDTTIIWIYWSHFERSFDRLNSVEFSILIRSPHSPTLIQMAEFYEISLKFHLLSDQTYFRRRTTVRVWTKDRSIFSGKNVLCRALDVQKFNADAENLEPENRDRTNEETIRFNFQIYHDKCSSITFRRPADQ